jgi:hypothetical protein
MNDLPLHSVSSQAQTPYRCPGRVAESEDGSVQQVNPSIFGFLWALTQVVALVVLGLYVFAIVCSVLLWGFFSCPVGFVAALVLWAVIGFMRFMARRAIRERAKRELHTS